MTRSTRRAFLLLAVLPAGFATGYLLRPTASSSPPIEVQNTRHPTRPTATPEILHSVQIPDPDLLGIRSTDTIANLVALHPDDLYPRLALWLIDAESSQIHELFIHLYKRPDLHIRHFGLLFTRWAVTDPLAAIAAAKGTSIVNLPWSGWAKKQPLAAFRHAMEHDRSMLEYVLMSIGESDPELAKSLLASHPEIPQDLASSGLIRGLAHDDPEAALDLVLQTGRHDFGPHEAWLRKDPHAAFQWFLKNREFYATHYSQTDAVIRSIVRENPEILAELAASTPPGALRRKMEAALFDRLVAENPEKALAEARANPSPLIARERLAKLGILQSAQDPQAARAILEEILKLPPVPDLPIYQPGQMAASSAYDPRVMELATTLATADPQGVLTTVLNAAPSLGQYGHAVATRWAAQDPAAFETWAFRQPDPSLQQNLTKILIRSYSEAKDFPQALTYLQRVPEYDRQAFAVPVITQWRDQDPKAARTWVEDAGMMDSMKALFETP